ncbi:unnamed protein product [Gongylonema pulchrum]|uniref:DPPIV_N domain-containing protein n=1 Tax=Gongylonema pulchrum TaxID=637853 RepID=A0A183E8L8_9BILA|nr:unnamed protein product [Gongylonema pulchrum]
MAYWQVATPHRLAGVLTPPDVHIVAPRRLIYYTIQPSAGNPETGALVSHGSKSIQAEAYQLYECTEWLQLSAAQR